MNIKKVLASVSIIALSYSSVGLAAVSAKSDANSDSETSRKIVVFKDGASGEVRDKVLGARLSARRIKRFENSFKADVVERMTEAEAALLAANPNVLRVETDAVATIQAHNVTIQAQTLPWGISKIKADQVWPSGNTADPINVGVIDTGIALKHQDLSANIKGSYKDRKSTRLNSSH